MKVSKHYGSVSVLALLLNCVRLSQCEKMTMLLKMLYTIPPSSGHFHEGLLFDIFGGKYCNRLTDECVVAAFKKGHP